jgi:hypothetical protein
MLIYNKLSILYISFAAQHLSFVALSFAAKLFLKNLSKAPLLIGKAAQRGDEKPIPALKINIFWDMAYSIPYLVPTRFQESIFFLITTSKNTARPKISAL